jgi:hypothetical protein
MNAVIRKVQVPETDHSSQATGLAQSALGSVTGSQADKVRHSIHIKKYTTKS